MNGLPRHWHSRACIPWRLTAVLVGGGVAGALALVFLADRLLEGLYESWRPRLEQQVGRVMGHPLELGPYRGVGADGLRIGPSRFLAGAEDGSTASAASLHVLLDPLASWRRGLLVLDISLGGARADLRPNARGQLWELGRLPPGGEPPPLELRFRLPRQGDVALHGRGAGQTPWRLRLAGQVELLPRQRRLQGRARLESPEGPGSALLVGGGNWQRRRWGVDVLAQRAPLQPFQRLLPRSVRLQGHADGRLSLVLERGALRCGGQLQLRDVRWRQAGLAGPIAADRLPVTCAADRLLLAPSAWRHRDWRGQVSGVLHRDRSLAVRLSARPPRGQALASGPIEARLAGRWQGASLRGARLALSSGDTRLTATGTLGRSLALAGTWRLHPAALPQAGRIPPWLRSRPVAGRFSLEGPLARPQLAVATALQASHPVLGAWQASLRWSDGLLRLERFDAEHLQARAELPLDLQRGRGLVSGPLTAWIDLRDFPLSGLDALVGTRLHGRLDGRGTLRGPLTALVPDLEVAVRAPGAGPLRLQESWGGSLLGAGRGGGVVRLQPLASALPGRLEARLDSRWRPTQVRLERDGGHLELAGDPRLFHWQARALPLHGLELLPPRRRPPQPLEGWLGGEGQLGLQPLAFQGRVELRSPGVFGLSGRGLQASLRYRERQYQVRGTVEPLSGGTVATELRGRWGGGFQARLQARQLSSDLFRQMAWAWDRWRGRGGSARGRASDLGQPAIETLGYAVQDQLLVLDTVRERLQVWEESQRRATRAERLERLQMRLDADLSLQGPDLRRARADLEARGHLWMQQGDRDLSLARDPFSVTLQGPLFQGGGTFALSGLTLALFSLLTPVPDSLRGYLSVRGRYRLGGGPPELAMDLALEQAQLGTRSLWLQRGRLELEPRGLEMDLALQAQGASSTVDLSGLLPLQASSRTMELRLASRGDGLRFLTDLAGRAITWRRGSADLQLLVRGSLLDPIANGFLRLREGEYAFIGQSLQGVEATVLFDFQQLLVQDLRARVGRDGRISGEGRLGLVRPLSEDPTLAVRLQGVPFAVERIRAVADGDLRLGGSLAAPELGGDVTISRGVINARPGQLARLESSGGTGEAPASGSAPLAPAAAAAGSAAPGSPSPGSIAPGSTLAAAPGAAPPPAGSPPAGGPGSGAASRPTVRPTSMNELLQRRWDFREPLLLLGPDTESTTNLSLQEAIPNLPWLRFENLRLAFGPDLRMVIPSIANFTTGGALRLNGRLDPSLRASGVVRLLKGRLNLFTTTFSLDPDAPNVAVFTPTLGLVPYLDIALRTRIADNLNTLSPSGLGEATLQTLSGPGERDSRAGFSSFNQLNLILVTVSVSGSADRIAEHLRLRSSPPLPQERLVALIGGNSLAGLRGGQAGTALATALGQSLLSPLLASVSDALGQRVSLALYPTYVNQTLATGRERLSGRVPPQLVLAGEVGFDISDRLNASVLAAPNRSDVPAQITLNYKASNTWNIGASVDTQGAWQGVLQFFFRF